ncbi:MAG: septum formation initiator family protein [Ignavibacteriales bacterium]|nr:septum formation initiator family protein [Ignavibacteriales bacterium]
MKIQKNKILLFVYAGILLIILSFFIFSDYGLLRFLSLSNEIDELNTKIEKSEKKIDKSNKEIDSLKTSDAKIEKVARERYYMRRANEKVIKIDIE